VTDGLILIPNHCSGDLRPSANNKREIIRLAVWAPVFDGRQLPFLLPAEPTNVVGRR
jgi:hypothetical protein